ncbi:glycosyltransferase family 2 protein [Rhodococcus sp. 14-2470-1a]|uniref:glycosyltransferase n=1 Tax=Rhodococcus sp. 14-2470-1a TaxID=2023150 RepID=UPI000B9C27F9|nr:glycosyltransferase family A protein [Rhodococcus sp. 14-2470-1a]OZF46338.1 glycosyl transferase [Rhodococcus sp. 14-2470-1a]
MTDFRDAVRRATAAGAALAGVGAATTLVNALSMRSLRRPTSDVPGSVAVCIPARNEVDLVSAVVTDLRQQVHCPTLEVFVLDDGSTDGTFGAAVAAADSDPRFDVRRSTTEPPPGWTGKAAACRTLAARALAGEPDWIAFVDADVRLSAGAIAAAVTELRRGRSALVSPWPRQRADSVAEHLVQPLLSFSWLSTLPVRVANTSTRPSTVVACGQFLMFDAAAYRDVGGHESVASSATEDLDIARALRRAGHRTAVVLGGELARCRMYDGWSDLRAGYSRWLWSAFGGPVGSTAVLGAAALAYVLPPVAAVFGSGRTRRWGLVGYGAAVAARVVAARAESGVVGPGAVAAASVHPVSVLLYGALTVDSFLRSRTGSITWKGRPL